MYWRAGVWTPRGEPQSFVFRFVAVFVAIGVEVIMCRRLLGNLEEIPPEHLAGLQLIR